MTAIKCYRHMWINFSTLILISFHCFRSVIMSDISARMSSTSTVAADRTRGDDGEIGGPGAAYQVFVVMEEFLDKLKLLHYEETFCRQLGFKPFNRYKKNFPKHIDYYYDSRKY